MILVQLLLVPPGLAAEQDKPLQAIGRAFDETAQTLLYSEYHYCDSALTCTIEYRKPDGELIAQKELDYTYGPHSPALVMVDFLNGKEQRLGFDAGSNNVIDAGFDNYVRSKWTELAAGDSVKFPFEVPGFDRALPMEALRSNLDQCAREELCLRVSVDSWLLGLLADPILLSYERDSRRLLRFRGISNLRDEGGDSFYVDIRYEYPVPGAPAALAAGDSDELARLQGTSAH